MREDSAVGGEDDDDAGQDDEADPNPEVDADAEVFGDTDGEAVVEVVAAGRSPAGAFSEEHEVLATVRYRASYGGVEKNPIHCAADTFADY